jgi:hypothetical protein
MGSEHSAWRIALWTTLGCFQIRLGRITTATIKALTCFYLSPPLRAGNTPEACKSKPPALRVVVDSENSGRPNARPYALCALLLVSRT